MLPSPLGGNPPKGLVLSRARRSYSRPRDCPRVRSEFDAVFRIVTAKDAGRGLGENVVRRGRVAAREEGLAGLGRSALRSAHALYRSFGPHGLSRSCPGVIPRRWSLECSGRRGGSGRRLRPAHSRQRPLKPEKLRTRGRRFGSKRDGRRFRAELLSSRSRGGNGVTRGGSVGSADAGEAIDRGMGRVTAQAGERTATMGDGSSALRDWLQG